MLMMYMIMYGHIIRMSDTVQKNLLLPIVLFFTQLKSKDNHFYKDQVAVPYKNPTDKRILNNLANGSKGRMPYSWFYFDLVKNVSKDKTFHACQIPLALVEMLIKSCTQNNDDVFILFGGSGSEIVLCKNLKRNFISCEIHPDYYQMILDRLDNNGAIKDEYRLDFIQQKNGKALTQIFDLFAQGK